MNEIHNSIVGTCSYRWCNDGPVRLVWKHYLTPLVMTTNTNTGRDTEETTERRTAKSRIEDLTRDSHMALNSSVKTFLTEGMALFPDLILLLSSEEPLSSEEHLSSARLLSSDILLSSDMLQSSGMDTLLGTEVNSFLRSGATRLHSDLATEDSHSSIMEVLRAGTSPRKEKEGNTSIKTR